MIFAGAVNGQTNDLKTQDDKIYEKSEVDEAPKFLKKRPPSISGCDAYPGMSGKVELRVVFRKSGEVTDVEVVSTSPCAAYNKSALKTVKKIKFKPAIKDAQPVSVRLPVVYTYSSY